MIKCVFGLHIAVKDLEEATPKYEALLRVKALPVPDGFYAFPGIKGVAFDLSGARLALLTSDDENNPVGSFLKNRGEGIIVLSLEVDDIEKDVEQLRAKGKQFLLPQNAEGLFGKCNFIHPKTMNGV